MTLHDFAPIFTAEEKDELRDTVHVFERELQNVYGEMFTFQGCIEALPASRPVPRREWRLQRGTLRLNRPHAHDRASRWPSVDAMTLSELLFICTHAASMLEQIENHISQLRSAHPKALEGLKSALALLEQRDAATLELNAEKT